jgi:hypothetical protein
MRVARRPAPRAAVNPFHHGQRIRDTSLAAHPGVLRPHAQRATRVDKGRVAPESRVTGTP